MLMFLPSVGTAYFLFGLLGVNSIFLFIILYIACLFWQIKNIFISTTLPLIVLLFSLVANYLAEVLLIFIPINLSFSFEFGLYVIISYSTTAGLSKLTRYIFVRSRLNRFIDKRYLWALIVFLALLIIYIYFNITIMQQTGTMNVSEK